MDKCKTMTQKKEILHIIQSLDNGGCENMLLRLLPLIDDFEHKIITLKELGELASKFVSAGIAVETIHCNSLFDIPGILRLRELVREENPDVIITYLFHADMLGRLLLRTKHTLIIPFLRTTYNHPKYVIARILEWLTNPLVKKYLANSEAVKDFYVKNIGVQPEKITVIPNGIDIAYFDSITPDPELRKSLGIKPDDFVIICVANLHINKGHRYLLEAFEQLHSLPSHPFQGGESKRGLKLILVGDGTERKNLEQQIKNYQSKNNILFLGRRTDIPQLLKISDIFVLPTMFEGMSNAILEAMASGLPVITTGIPENKEIIEDNKTGLIVPVKNSIALAQTIEKLLGDKNQSESLGGNARKKIQEYFDLKIITTKTAKFFSQY